MLELETKKLSTECSHYLDNTNAQLITLSHTTNQLHYQKLFADKNGDFSKKCLKLPKISNSNNNPPEKIKLSKNCGIIAIQYGQTLHFFNYNRSGDHLEVPGYKFEAEPKSGKHPTVPVDHKSRLLDFFWTGKSTILLVFGNGLRTLLINDKQSVTCFGGFKFEEEIDFSICWSEDSNPSTRLQKDWIRNEIGKNLFNTVAIGTADAKLILFRCQETTIHQLQTIVVDRSRCAESKKGRRRSISQDCRPVSSTVGSWVMDVVSMPGRILSSSYTPKNDDSLVGNSGDAKKVENPPKTSSRSRTTSRSITIEEDHLEKLSLASGYSTSSSRSGTSNSVSAPKKLLRSSTNLMFVYDQLFVSILCKSRHFYQLHLYRVLNKNQPQTLAHVLRLKRSGRFFVQIVDHLILLHHLEEKETLVFDIAYLVKRHRAISGSEGSSSSGPFFNDDSKFHYSKYKHTGHQHAMPYYHDPIAIVSLPSYSKNWKNCCNQVIFSKKYNEMMYLKLNLGKVVMPLEEQSQMSQLQMDPKDIIRFLQRRIECSILDAKNAIIDYTNNLDPEKLPFDVIIEDLRQEKPVEENVETKPVTKSILISNYTSKATPNSALDIKKVMLKSTQDHSRKFHFLTQREILTKILENPKNYSRISYTTILSIIKTAKLYQHKPVITELHLLLVKKLIEAGQVSLLKQLLLQRIVMDDDSIGCYLLKNGHTELGLDIFRRLGADHVEQAVEVLMLTEQVERCVKYAIVNKREDCLVPARLLEVVKNDDLRFISVFNYCLKRNFRVRGTNEFSGRDRCEEYVQLYKRLVCV